MNKLCLWVFILLMGAQIKFLTNVYGQENYPVPKKTKNQLFYFQRSHNKNTIIYELNTLPDGHINPEKPVNTYWIRYEEGGCIKPLTFLQKKAYDLSWKIIDPKKGSYVLHFNGSKKRDIYLQKEGGNGQYKAYTTINGELSELTKMYLKSENNSLGIPLSIKYIDITGVSLKNGKPVVERFIP